eukprot:CAMPEP_0115517742 /NCGR_PEP_ID=MMETSP0271-20121206/77481_1 /TAXON_ID=71861 /ORGANISM="Scrippsiella trochoidea, Strain CCMP3099" /LENGTH=82 /DNA_ID=CAMNT_0002948539 /DNA_START=222 /DNA_END=467 /DNA_ORIENTATION=+
MPKKNVASAIAVKAAGGPPMPGAPIPTPSGTPGPHSTQRLSVLSQEEFLAAILAEHWEENWPWALALPWLSVCRSMFSTTIV